MESRIQDMEKMELLLDPEEENHQPRVDTFAILKKLENKQGYVKTNKALEKYKAETIDYWNQKKHWIHAGASATGIFSTLLYAGFLAKFFMQSSEQVERYMNTMVESIKDTCGNLIPFSKNVCNSFFNSTDSDFCEMLSFYKRFAGFAIDTYLEECGNFSLNNYCSWTSLGDLAYECTTRMSQYYFGTCVPHTSYGRINFQRLSEVCGNNTFLNSICEYQPNITILERCGLIALDACDFITRSNFNMTIPNQDYNCADKFVSPDVYSVCKDALPCDVDLVWWTGPRKALISILTIGLAYILGVGLISMFGGLEWIDNKSRVTNLPEQDQEDFFQLLKEFEIEAVDEEEDLKVTDGINLLDKVNNKIQRYESYLKDMAHSFLLFRQDPGSVIPHQLPSEVAHRIFHFAGLCPNGPTR